MSMHRHWNHTPFSTEITVGGKWKIPFSYPLPIMHHQKGNRIQLCVTKMLTVQMCTHHHSKGALVLVHCMHCKVYKQIHALFNQRQPHWQRGLGACKCLRHADSFMFLHLVSFGFVIACVWAHGHRILGEICVTWPRQETEKAHSKVLSVNLTLQSVKMMYH